MWFLVLWTGELGRNGGFAFVYGVPAVCVLLVWRTRPWLALGLAALTLALVTLGATNGTPVNEGGVLACSTAWFALLGASLSEDSRLRTAAALLVAVDTVLAGVNNGFPSLMLVLLLGGAALLAGWAARQQRSADRLRIGLRESVERNEHAERDVLLELERNRIAREVHDVVAHSLAVVVAQADGARFAAESRPETVGPALEAIADTARRALGEVRTMLHDLRTSGEGGEVPGPKDLDGLVEGIRALGVDVDAVVFGEPRPLDERIGLALYRIAQEALTNAMRHGDRSAPVGFELDWGDREVVLVVTNAVPVEAVPASERSGHGVRGMRERAADADGDCTAGIGSNGRFRVRVALPVPLPPEPAPDPAEHRDGLAALLSSISSRA